jgi:hypothetical protein
MGHHRSQFDVSSLAAARPRAGVLWQIETAMIGACDLIDKTVNSSDINPLPFILGSSGKDITGSMGVGED